MDKWDNGERVGDFDRRSSLFGPLPYLPSDVTNVNLGRGGWVVPFISMESGILKLIGGSSSLN